MKNRTIVELPGYVTVAVAAERLRLAPRSVRDLVYAGRLPSARLGRRHFLRVTDVEAERRRRLGLSLPQARTARRRAARAGLATTRPRAFVETRVPVSAAPSSEARRARARERMAQLERWLRNGRASAPALPFTAVELASAAACDACHRPVRAGGRMVDAAAADGRPAARLCLTCARRSMLAWSDERRRDAIAARRMAQGLGPTYVPLLEPTGAAA